jgi:hypothetical protein
LVIPVLRYSFGIINWHKEEIQKLDRKTRKMLTIHGQRHPKADIDRLYVPRKDGLLLLLLLTPWRQNPNVQHRFHNIPPSAPILSQLDPLYTPPANLPKIHSDLILSMPWSSKWSPSFWLPH